MSRTNRSPRRPHQVRSPWGWLSVALTCVFSVFLINCAPTEAPHETLSKQGEKVIGATVTTDHSTYTSGQTVTVTYSGLPGNQNDWIAIAAPGAPDQSYFAYVYTNGQTSGTATFSNLPQGTWVARSYPNNTYNLLAESDPFTIGAAASATVTTDHATYTSGQTVTVTYSGLPGNATDWIGIIPQGSPDSAYVQYVYTGGSTSGTATFSGLAQGTYVARAFPNNTYNELGSSAPFTVGAAVSVTTDHASYTVGDTVTVTYSGLPGNATDWIGIAAQGSPDTSYVQYVFTGGSTSGTATFSGLPAGTWVARAFPNNTFNLLAESAPFTIAASAVTVTTDHSVYSAGQPVVVTYSGMPGNQTDWIAIAPQGSPDTTYLQYVFTAGQTSGTATFNGLAQGTYVARAFPNNTFNKLGESAAFTVGPAISVSTNLSSYSVGQTVTVTYSGLPGNSTDWIAIAAPGASDQSYIAYVYTGGATSGTATFNGLAAGSYVARAYPNNTYEKLAESATFTVNQSSVTVTTDQSSYSVGDTITVTFSGMPGNANDWIGIVPQGSPDTSYVQYVFTGGATSGSVTFRANSSGTFFARAFPNNTFNEIGSSSAFTVN